MPYQGFPSDPASEVLDRVRMRVDLVCLSTFHAPWGIAFPDGPSHLHIVRTGLVWARLSADGEAVRALAGDLLLFPRGAGHIISDGPVGEAVPLDQVACDYDAATMSMELPGTGVASELVCCRFNVDGGMSELLLRALPPMIHVRGVGRSDVRLDSALRLLSGEVSAPRPGSKVVVSRLIDVLLVETLRAWAQTHDRNLSWLAGIGDPRIGRVLAAFHDNPARDWTTVACAKIAGLSRSAFADRFTRIVGEPPLAYLKRWRLGLAADLIASGAPKISEVARRVGYASDSAFNRAFKSRFAATPAAYRTAA